MNYIHYIYIYMYLSVLMLLKTKNPKKKRTLLPARRHFLPFTKRISPKIRKYENLLTLPPFVCDLSFVEIRSIRSDYIHDTLYTTHQKPKTKNQTTRTCIHCLISREQTDICIIPYISLRIKYDMYDLWEFVCWICFYFLAASI